MGSKEGPPCARRCCSQRLFGTGRDILRIPGPTLGPYVRLNAGWSLADDIAVLRPGCPLGDGHPPDPFVLVDAYDFL